MNLIQYKPLNQNNLPAQQIISLYQSVGWMNYTKDTNSLLKGIQNSLFTLTAFSNNELIALIRVVGDGETIIYIQDLLVHPEYQNQRVGEELMQRVLSKYEQVRQKVLICDKEERLLHFYEKIGFKQVQDCNLVCFVRL